MPYSVRRRHNAPRPASGFEKAGYALLKKEKIPFELEKVIGHFHVDTFIKPGTIVELQGCYGFPLCLFHVSGLQGCDDLGVRVGEGS